MKKLAISFLVLTALVACKKNNTEIITPPVAEEEENVLALSYQQTLKPIVFEFTSTGCPGCGSWGKPTFYSIIKEFNDGVVPIAAHIKYGDPMITPISEAIAANRYGQFYTPQIWVNDTNGVQLVGGSINSTASINYMRQLINQYDMSDFVHIDGKEYPENSNGIKVRVGIKHNGNASFNDLFLSCYLMENGLIHNQSSAASNPTTHNHVIRKAADGAWGKAANFTDNTFEYDYIFEGETSNENKYFALILWKKDGNRYVPIGGHSFK